MPLLRHGTEGSVDAAGFDPVSLLLKDVRMPADDEYSRRAELPLKDIDAFNHEFSAWLERHPELKDAGRPAQLREWLRATD
jgi:hypothetical protein